MVQDVKAAAYVKLRDQLTACAAMCNVRLQRVSIDRIARDAIIGLDDITGDDIDAIPPVVLHVFVQLVGQYDQLKAMNGALEDRSDTGRWFHQNALAPVTISMQGEVALAPIVTEGLAAILNAAMASRKEPESAV
jgi:hypothetical protein